MHAFLWALDSQADLRRELEESLPGDSVILDAPGWIEVTNVDARSCDAGSLPRLVFARQCLPDAKRVKSASVRGWAEEVIQRVIGVLPDDRPWALHVEPHYYVRTTHRVGARAWHTAHLRTVTATPKAPGVGGSPEAGRNRCGLIRAAIMELLRKKRRHLLRNLQAEPQPFESETSLVQVLLTSPEDGFVSIAAAPLPLRATHLISPFPKGEVATFSDKAAPSRAFAKLVEAELRLGRQIGPGETCVDLGAAPGSWTYVAVHRGAKVTAVDRAPLGETLMASRNVRFEPGDAFKFAPKAPVDWLLCDVIAPPERTADLLRRWLRHGWCRNFVVTLKLKDDALSREVLTGLKSDLPKLASPLFMMRLSANKKEAAVFGTAASKAGESSPG